jgi:exosome complex exonuclease DIS3/RRP44
MSSTAATGWRRWQAVRVFYVGLALKSRGKTAGIGGMEGTTREEAFVIRTFRNGLAVFVSK